MTRFLPFRPLGYEALAPWPGVILAHDRLQDAPDWRREALLDHERVHHRQQREYGPVRWLARYLFDGEFRARQEAEAYSVNVRAEAKHGVGGELGLAREYAGKIVRDYYPAWWPPNWWASHPNGLEVQTWIIDSVNREASA